MKITVVQPPYFAGEEPDEAVAKFLMAELDKAQKGSLIVFPEYSNAGGLSDPEKEIAALPRAEKMLQKASAAAKEKECYVAINVLERREGKIKNSTYLFGKTGKVEYRYDKVHLPPSELSLGVERGTGDCFAEIDGIRFGFLTCYDVYFNEQIEFLAKKKPDLILVPGYQRGERSDIIQAQGKLLAFRCNAFVARSSYSMGTPDRGGNTMIVSPEGIILENMEERVGSVSRTVEEKEKYMRPAGFGGNTVRNDDFIGAGLLPELF